MKSKETAAIVGQLIAEIRKNKGLKQSELADRMNVDFQMVSNYERGMRDPSVDLLIRFCEGLEVDPGDFMTEIIRRKSV